MSKAFVDATSGESLWVAGNVTCHLVETVVEALAAQQGLPSGMTWTEYDECHIDADVLAALTRRLVQQWDATSNITVHRILSGVLPHMVVLGERAGRSFAVDDRLADFVATAHKEMVVPRR